MDRNANLTALHEKYFKNNQWFTTESLDNILV
jgi:hypothetical protein